MRLHRVHVAFSLGNLAALKPPMTMHLFVKVQHIDSGQPGPPQQHLKQESTLNQRQN